MKKLLIIAIIGVLLATAGILSKDAIAKYFIEKEIKSLGVQLQIEKLHVNVFKSSIMVNNITIYNPPGFRKDVLAEISELYINFSFIKLLSKNIHLAEVKFDLSKLYIEKTKQGKINLNELDIGSGDSSSPIDYHIDKLILTLGHVKAVDYSRGMTPNIIDVDMRIEDEVFTNITDISAVVQIVKNKIIANHLFLALGIEAVDIAEVPIEGAADIIGDVLPFDHEERSNDDIDSNT